MGLPIGAPTGVKHDGGKARMGIVPPFALESVAEVLTFGAQKYQVDNWKYVDNAKARYIDAALRHINEYNKGEWTDSESNLPVLAHAICCLMFILDLELEQESLEDKATFYWRTNPLQAALHDMIARHVDEEKREADGWTDEAIKAAAIQGTISVGPSPPPASFCPEAPPVHRWPPLVRGREYIINKDPL